MKFTSTSLPLAGLKWNGFPFWSVSVKLGAGVFTSLRPISPFFGGIGRCASADKVGRPVAIRNPASQTLLCRLKLIGDVQILGAFRQVAAHHVGAGKLQLLLRRKLNRQQQTALDDLQMLLQVLRLDPVYDPSDNRLAGAVFHPV